MALLRGTASLWPRQVRRLLCLATWGPAPSARTDLEVQDIDWIRDVEKRMNFDGKTTDDLKMGFLRSCGYVELTNLLEKEARIWFKSVEVNGEREEEHT